MYRAADKTQSSFINFNQPIGLHMNPNNRWIRMADKIPWDKFEKRYADLYQAILEMWRNLCGWHWVH